MQQRSTHRPYNEDGDRVDVAATSIAFALLVFISVRLLMCSCLALISSLSAAVQSNPPTHPAHRTIHIVMTQRAALESHTTSADDTDAQERGSKMPSETSVRTERSRLLVRGRDSPDSPD
jgi:hypothetical protein